MRSVNRWDNAANVMSVCTMICLTLVLWGAAAFGATPFDHAKTGFILRDVHTTLRCEQCHVDGIFKNTPQDCAGCHSVGSRVGATPKPLNHVQTTSPCDVCHTSPSNFLVKSFKHIGVSGGCAACHNGQSLGVVSKPLNHFPTLLPCETCHTNTATFLSWKMDHTGITSNCAFCHSGQFPNVMSKPVAHILTAAPCESCHKSTVNFNDGTFSHATMAVAGVCNSCHLGQFIGVTSQPPNHIPTSGAQCDVCHTTANTGGYTSFIGATYDHAGAVQPLAAGNCSNCHTGLRPGVPGKAANHIPTSAQCDTCHTASNTRNYLTFQGASAHMPPVGACATCHNGVYAKGKAAVHIPTTAACETCHTQTNTANFTSFLGATFVHGASPGVCASCHNGVAATGKMATHVLTSAACDACHTQANTANFTTFLGAVFLHAQPLGACSSCHNGVIATGKSRLHVATTAECNTCHTQSNTANYSTFLGAMYVHPTPPGVCASCHNGTVARGKPLTHIFTTAACDTCHTQSNTANFTSFLGAVFTHVMPIGVCASCHNGVTATGKPSFHIATTAACDACHTQANTANYTSFLGATFVHPTPPGVCSTCHDGVTARGKSAQHIPTTAACDTCHTQTNTANYTTFLGARYAHTAPVGVCASCHNGVSATGKPTRHIFTTTGCDACHTQSNTSNYTTFLGAIYTHAQPIGVCASCHNGVSATGKPAFHITTSAGCDVCHTQANTANYTTFLGATFVHVTPVGVCATCHDGVTAKGKLALHIPTTSACDTCHTQSNTANYTTFIGGVFAHTPPVGVCATCHNGVSATGKSAVHVATTAACDVCHTQSNTANYTTFLGATFVHIAPIGVCASCHNGVVALGKPPTHVATTAACDLCHTQANTSNFTTFLGAVYSHATPPGVCATCHNGVTALGKPSFHMVTNSACDSCHTQSNTANYTTFTGATGAVDHAAIPAGNCQSCHNGTTAKGLSTGHIPVGALSCDGCHAKFNGTTVTTFSPATMNHALVTATRCDTCHGGAYTTQGVKYGGAQAKVTRHIPTTITGSLDCNTCHTNPVYTSATGWSAVRMNHNGAQGGGVPIYCVTCHLTGTTYQGAMQKKSHEGASMAKDCSRSSCHRPLGNKGAAYTRWN